MPQYNTIYYWLGGSRYGKWYKTLGYSIKMLGDIRRMGYIAHPGLRSIGAPVGPPPELLTPKTTTMKRSSTMLHRKDYKAIAAILNAHAEGHEDTILAIAHELCTLFQEENPRFSEQLFMEAVMPHTTLDPAGDDYKSKKAILDAFNRDENFVLGNGLTKHYVCKSQLSTPRTIAFRYAKLQKSFVYSYKG